MEHLRIFLSGPSDVEDENEAALQAIDRLRYDPFIRRAATLEPVHWRRVGAPPILATQTPQRSVDRGMPRPSDCDIVVVTLWARLGTPLPAAAYRRPDGSPYGSGTEWEFDDAVRACSRSGCPAVLLYRCTRPALVDATASGARERLRQVEGVKRFFDRLRDPQTGALTGGYREYRTVDDFRGQLESDLRELLHGLLVQRGPGAADPMSHPPLWRGSPFPGLRAFGPCEAPIFFGRGRETDELVARVREERFVAVVGASGSGKSSLAGAGLVARLAHDPDWLVPEQDAGSRQWSGLHLSPGELGNDPFAPLAARLAAALGLVPAQARAALAADPAAGSRLLTAVAPARRVLVVLDQFEELFSVVDPVHVPAFVDLLTRLHAEVPQARVVATLRADFYHRCLELPRLVRLLERGHFPLAAPRETLLEMILRPAERAGLRFADGLPGRMLADLGTDIGALPLLAYTLDELYRASGSGVLSHEAYEQLGGVRGAIGRRAEGVFTERLDDAARGAFGKVFQELVEVDPAGRVTRRRALVAAVTPASRRFVEVFTNARLLVQAADVPAEPTVSVAHEALFDNWPRLRDWIATVREDLRLLRSVTAAAEAWHENGRADAYRWPHERLAPVKAILHRLDPRLDDVVRDFLEPEWVRLLRTLGDLRQEVHHRQVAADRLLAIGNVVIPGLAQLMVKGAPAIRPLVSATLVRFAGGAVTALTGVLDSADAEVRLSALAALREIGDPRAVTGIAAGLADPDVRVRSMALGAIEALHGGVPSEGWVQADLDPAWQAVGRLGGLDAVRPLLIVAGGDDPEMRARALAAVLPLASGDRLVAALRDELPAVRTAAGAALAARGRPVPMELLAALRDPDPQVYARALEVVVAVGDPAAVEPLGAMLDDGDPKLGQAAVMALGRCGGQAVDALVGRLGDDRLADAAVAALAALGAPAVDRLADVLRGPQGPAVRARAVTALRGVGAPAVGALVALLETADAPGRSRAGGGLVALGDEAVPALVQVLESGSVQAADAAAELLAEIGDPALAALLERSDPAAPVRRRVAHALSGVAFDDARGPLLGLLNDGDAEVRAAAAASLVRPGTRHDADGLDLLVRAAVAEEDAVAETALRALAAAGPDAVGPLLDVAARHPNRAAGPLRTICTVSALLGLAELGVDPVPVSAEHVHDAQRQ